MTSTSHMTSTSAKLTVGSLRELSTVGVVSGLSAAYAAALLGASSLLDAVSRANGDGAIGTVLGIVASVFILIALFVSAIVIGNGVDTVIAGRREQLTLLRLVGASSKQLRGSLVRAVAAISAIGTVVGIVAGLAAVTITRIVLVHNGTIPDADYTIVPSGVLFAGLVVVGMAVAATLSGTHRTLASMAAIRPARTGDPLWRKLLCTALLGFGALLLAGACVLGEAGSSAGFFVAFFGAAITSTGIMVGARLVVPTLVALCGRAVGSGPAAVLARRNAVSDPLRTTRSTIGLLIGVTLVSTIATGMMALRESVRAIPDMTPEQRAMNEQVLSVTTTVLIAMIVISVIIAAVGFVSTMSLTVISRTREIGMLRAMGFTARQVRSMIFRESVALTGTAVTAGLVLGVIFGNVGSISLLGNITPGTRIALPLGSLAAIVAGTVVLVLAAALPPSRRAVSIPPVDALAVA